VLDVSGIEFVIDQRSEELLKRYGGAKLDYNENKYYGSGFSLKLKDVADC
jgi:hypothetical protein